MRTTLILGAVLAALIPTGPGAQVVSRKTLTRARHQGPFNIRSDGRKCPRFITVGEFCQLAALVDEYAL